MYFNEKSYKIRVSEIKCEKDLRKHFKEAFNNKKIDNIHILIDFHKEFKHINFIAFLATSAKNDYIEK